MYSTFNSFLNVLDLFSSFVFLLSLMFGCGLGFVCLCLPARLWAYRWLLMPLIGL